ncbi:MAG: heavy-metal-associated domain-containing protein [Candidatus Sulfotelmatobacter sp.]
MTTILRSDNISCPRCMAGLEKTLGAMEGVEYAKAWFSTGRIEIRHDPAHVSVKALVQAVRVAGYYARPSVM